MSEDESKLPIETLISRAGSSNYTRDSEITNRYLGLATAKMELENIALAKHSQEISEKQLDVSYEANLLTKKLLVSNEQASKENEKQAESLNKATVQLARSTSGLNRATWILAIFTGIQVVLAIIGFYISLQVKKP